jgi:hypothetical protein
MLSFFTIPNRFTFGEKVLSRRNMRYINKACGRDQNDAASVWIIACLKYRESYKIINLLSVVSISLCR